MSRTLRPAALLLYAATAGALVPGQPLRIRTSPDNDLWQRLESLSQDRQERAETLARQFDAAGCDGGRLTREEVKGRKEPNIVCTLPGTSDELIVIGAHHDHAGQGQGAVDNWSGATLLPALYYTLSDQPRHFTFILAGFSGEEGGLLGAEAFVKRLGKSGVRRTRAMINIDSIGLSPTKLWVSRSDPKLVNAIARVAAALKSPLAGVNVGQAGDTDSRIFQDKGIPVLDVHSVTNETNDILHSPRDTLAAIDRGHYKETYRLLAGFVVFIDRALRPPGATASAK